MARLQKKKTSSAKTKKKVRATDGLTGADSKADAGTMDGAVSKPSAVKPAAPKSHEIRGKAGAESVSLHKEPNIFQKGIRFFREVRSELKKVTWPNRRQTAGSTVVVIILVFIIASFLGLVDFGLSKLVQIVLA